VPGRFVLLCLAGAGLTVSGCVSRTPLAHVGPFEVVVKSDRTRWRFQPHYEFWMTPTGDGAGRRELLGVCMAPRFVRESMGLPGDPSCFALAEDGSALLYLHRPEIAGADKSVISKPSGLYRRTARGDSLVYGRLQVGQIFSRTPVPGGAMRLSWNSARPSAGGARCGQQIVVFAVGGEQVEGVAGAPGCRPDSLPP
jgi:hypothetical protein